MTELAVGKAKSDVDAGLGVSRRQQKCRGSLEGGWNATVILRVQRLDLQGAEKHVVDVDVKLVQLQSARIFKTQGHITGHAAKDSRQLEMHGNEASPLSNVRVADPVTPKPNSESLNEPRLLKVFAALNLRRSSQRSPCSAGRAGANLGAG